MDDNSALQRRTQEAIGKMHRRVERLERATISKQQLEDLMTVVPAMKDLLKRITRIENILLYNQRARESSIENDHIVAQEMVLIRDRVLTLEGRLAHGSD